MLKITEAKKNGEHRQNDHKKVNTSKFRNIFTECCSILSIVLLQPLHIQRRRCLLTRNHKPIRTRIYLPVISC